MKLKKGDKSLHAKKIRSLKRKIKIASNDAEALIDEHDSYSFASNEEASKWMSSLPIETLMDSVNRDYNKPRSNPSLRDIKEKFKLKKLYYSKKEEIEKLNNELKQAYIEYVLYNIENLESNLYGEIEK